MSLSAVAGGDQQAQVGTAVATAPTVEVLDAGDDPVVGVIVRFAVASGGGTVLGDSVVTDGNGRAVVGGWILGTSPGVNTLQATLNNTQVSTVFTATALAGAGASLQSSGQSGFLELVGQVVSPAPTVQVLDSYGNPVTGATVTFSVTAGGGTITGATATTDVAGHAQVGSWTLGASPGLNQLTARISGATTLVFSAQALTGPPNLTATSPVSQAGYLSFPVAEIPRVEVTDASGHPLAGVPVTFSASGDASVTGPVGISDTNGIATPDDWRLGASSSTLTATAQLGAIPVRFSATGVPAPFLIDLRFLTTMTPDVRDAFVAAARRWMGIITAHLTTVPVDLPAGACSGLQPAVNETVTDVIIFAQVEPIDGVGNILGSASPCATRSGSDLTVVGSMQFDSADLQSLVTTGQLVAVITHEMAHVLGFGTLWSTLDLANGLGTNDPTFIGAKTLALWPPFGLQLGYSGAPVPLENTGGAGTRDAHWRESVFHTELMTGWIEAPGVPMPLSRLTIATFADMGYQVDYSQADVFADNLLASGAVSMPTQMIQEQITGPRWRILPGGTAQRLY